MYRIVAVFILFTTIVNGYPTFPSRGQPRCYYGDRGSLTATCENVTTNFFRTTAYRFDNLDETLRCVGCNLDVILPSAFDLSGNHILYLDLQNGNITSLSISSFIGLVYMERLNLARNHIKNVMAGTFKGIKKLTWLDLSYNEINMLVRDSFAELGNLTSLYLNDNAIRSVDAGAFNKLSLLKDLHLQNNLITSLESVFFSLHSIKTIDLQNNSIIILKPEDINSTSVIEINLAFNKIRTIEEGSVSAANLEALNISNNQIEWIKPGAFKGSKILEFIDLENNQLKEVNQYTFARLYHLEFINLARNNLTTLQTSMFTHLPELRYLNLSQNKIKSIEKTGVLPLYNLHSLDVSHNQINYFDFKLLFEHAPRLVLINLENNSLPCYLVRDMMDFFKEDHVEFSIDSKYGRINETCNATALPKFEDIIEEAAKFEASSEKTNDSSDFYVIYSFIFILIGLVAALFFLNYKTYMHLKYGPQGDIAEVGLMSSRGLEGREEY